MTSKTEKILKTKQRGRILVSVSVPYDQWEPIMTAIELAGTNTSEFFLSAARARTRQVLATLQEQDDNADA
jgi:uncharacterized protein (DUF1778 family)